MLMADISNNNGSVDIPAYAAAGFKAIAIKATEGTGFVDPDHRGWCYSAHAHRLAVFHYHFGRPDHGQPAADEAAFFLKHALPLVGWNDYLVLDSERGGPGNSGDVPGFCRAFDQYVLANSRFHTILYASRSVLQQSDQWLVNDKKRLWDADWSSGPDVRVPGYVCAIRQFTDGVYGPDPHSLPGIGHGDGNIIRQPALVKQILHHGR